MNKLAKFFYLFHQWYILTSKIALTLKQTYFGRGFFFFRRHRRYSVIPLRRRCYGRRSRRIMGRSWTWPRHLLGILFQGCVQFCDSNARLIISNRFNGLFVKIRKMIDQLIFGVVHAEWGIVAECFQIFRQLFCLLQKKFILWLYIK